MPDDRRPVIERLKAVLGIEEPTPEERRAQEERELELEWRRHQPRSSIGERVEGIFKEVQRPSATLLPWERAALGEEGAEKIDLENTEGYERRRKMEAFIAARRAQTAAVRAEREQALYDKNTRFPYEDLPSIPGAPPPLGFSRGRPPSRGGMGAVPGWRFGDSRGRIAGSADDAVRFQQLVEDYFNSGRR